MGARPERHDRAAGLPSEKVTAVNAPCRARPCALAVAALFVAAEAVAQAPDEEIGPGPVALEARAVEFRRHDPATGEVDLLVLAREGSMRGSRAELADVRFVKFAGTGGSALPPEVFEARAASASFVTGEGACLAGDVEVVWPTPAGPARLDVPELTWDEAAGTLATDAAVRGSVARHADGRGAEPGITLELEGNGLRLLAASCRGAQDFPLPAASPDVSAVAASGRQLAPRENRNASCRGEIARDAVVTVTGLDAGPFRLVGDGRLEFARGGMGVTVLRLAGPVDVTGRDAAARSDAVEIHLRADERSVVGIAGVWATGLVRATGRARQPVFLGRADDAGADVPVELRASAMEVLPGAAGLVLRGTGQDPARVIFPSGELRGGRIDLGSDRIASDGGAPSEFAWESAVPDLSAAAQAGGRQALRVRCDGAVEWTASARLSPGMPDYGGRLALAGGVVLARQDLTVRAARSFIEFAGGSPAHAAAEGGVAVESGRLAASAEKVELRNLSPADGGAFEIHLAPGTLGSAGRAVELRAKGAAVACEGQGVYDPASRTARLSGGVRAATGTLRFSCDEATVVFAAAGDSKHREASPPAVERMDLAGAVVIQVVSDKGDLLRTARAARAEYDGSAGTVALSGEPAPEIVSPEAILTAPGIVIFVDDNRVESTSGRMRMIIRPEAPPAPRLPTGRSPRDDAGGGE